jgi:RNA polymerase sigma-70 factor, ECF subfamily
VVATATSEEPPMEGIVLPMFVEEGSPAPQAPTARAVGDVGSSADSAVLEAAYVARARAGDASSFRWLFERFGSLVHAIALSNGAGAEVDDVKQDVFLAAWRALPNLRSEMHFAGWLAQIARHRALRAAKTRVRSRATRELEPDAATSRDHEPTPTDILHVLTTLPAAYRETLALRLIENLQGPEIARLTGMTHGSVRVNLTRGMEHLREALRERGWT